MTKNYSYPLDFSWSTDEISSVLSFLNRVEEAYESRVGVKAFMEAYRAFKKVVPSKMEEKQIDRDFEKVSGYSSYRALQAAKNKEEGWISLGR
ncbi:hypothetical cytosolic protein [Streptococcus criceti]|uniref:UPF0223 protein STRCR_1280 n=1 Tax=Streptococcus criceti HS-6 TaxID=873449 RepID=G5JML8_STRCG|nr:UPF0223 family protein [Streptococcus criceti]EHI73538.1 hypothetical protein STRCR_1280 [Streptococcus criceti HS-6]SUN38735.1 hypothetical cytosolic protein [Streptococcus criceti]